MIVSQRFQSDVEALLAKRHENGADFGATADGRWGVGSPFSTFDCALMLYELGLKRSDAVMKGIAEVVFRSWKDDGRISPGAGAPVYPCHTANAARVLCRLGYAQDGRLTRTFAHLLDTQHDDGGWRCNTVKLGRSERTDASNPGVTLAALDAFRFTGRLNTDERLGRAVAFLLKHWTTRKPRGPCEFGIGTFFMRVEFPFWRYNLFYYVYVLSFYDAARKEKRFLAALPSLESKLVEGKMIVESPKRGLGGLRFCKKGEPSPPATARYREIRRNLDG